MRYFITLSYNGSSFSGWQVQPGTVTVQGCIENALAMLLKAPVTVIGAGRTDSKVNAVGYMAHFDHDGVIDTALVGYKLNAILPKSIVVHSIRAEEGDLHARFSASEREYTYFLHRSKDPFADPWSCFCPWKLDVDAMNRAAKHLKGTHDFRCFEKAGSDNRTSICTVRDAGWTPYEPSHVSLMGFRTACPSPKSGLPDVSEAPYLYFRITADRFLRNMVRAVVGSLLEVGRGRWSEEDFASLVLPPEEFSLTEGRVPGREMAGESVPGHALFLSGVKY